VESIQDLLHPVVAGLLRQAPFSEEKLACAWRMTVGTDLARVSLVHAGHGGVLTVSVDDRRWQPELERSRAMILARLQAVLGPDVARTLRFAAPDAPAARTRPAGPPARGRHRHDR
jgi:predicted nucleic acid-binding Zn ribbon protein